MFNKIIKDIKYQEVDINEAVKYNPSSFKSANIPEKREEFMNVIFNGNFEEIAFQYTKISIIKKIRNKIVSILNGILKNFKKGLLK